jgi:hypothetical protein
MGEYDYPDGLNKYYWWLLCCRDFKRAFNRAAR